MNEQRLPLQFFNRGVVTQWALFYWHSIKEKRLYDFVGIIVEMTSEFRKAPVRKVANKISNLKVYRQF
jgi:hypothetical protein